MLTRVLVTGSRSWYDEATIKLHLRELFDEHPRAILMHGAARGVDAVAARLWRSWGGAVEAHRADWERYGPRAGYVRNARMVERAPIVCIAFIHNQSKGASMCVELARAAGIETRVFELRDGMLPGDD